MTALRRYASRAGVILPAVFDEPADQSPQETAGNEPSGGPMDWVPLRAASQGGVPPEVTARAVAEAIGAGFLEDVDTQPASAQFVEKVPIGYARRHCLIGLASTNGRMPVAISGLDQMEQLEIVARYLGKPVKPVFALPGAIQRAVNLAYQQRNGQADALIQKLDAADLPTELASAPPGGAAREDLLDVASRAPVIKLVNLVLFEAIKQQASDVHIQPYEDKLVVRMRIDGILFDAHRLPKAMQEEVISRIKVMGKMNIAEKRLPQDGRATVQVGDRIVDLRIASLPGAHGERVVLRLLDKSARLYNLPELGMDPLTLKSFRELINVEHGLVLVTGPTGSGKTTTLYAALQEINSTECNIVTLEDPIEYQLPGVSQTQVSEKKGMTFASGLRSVLRQDPDIIMIGEIRDHETAVMAIQSALTGHLVFSTLHTNDAASAITRLLDLGIEPYLAASSVVGVLAQRLVRRVCGACSDWYEPATEELARLELAPREAQLTVAPSDTPAGSQTPDSPSEIVLTAPPAQTAPGETTFRGRRGKGCEVCRKTGYSGRVGLFELLLVDEAVRRQIQAQATASQIKATGVEHGMRTLRDDGVRKFLAGTTTIDEIARVTMRATL